MAMTTVISESQIIETTNAKIRFVSNDIMHVCYKPDIALEIADFKEPLEVLKNLSEENFYKVIVEFPMHTHASPEARKWAMETSLPAVAEAIVFKSLAQRIIIRFYLLVNKQSHPVKIFTDKEDAINWLNSI